MKKIAVLCVQRNSIYYGFDFCDCYGEDRDAFTYTGNLKTISHAPCRTFSTFCKHQAKPIDYKRERDLAVYCAEKVIQNGGVIEHPKHSELFTILNLPKPGKRKKELATVEVNQCVWGFPTTKKTWLCFSQVKVPAIPEQFEVHGNSIYLSRLQRSRTTFEFAQFLISAIL